MNISNDLQSLDILALYLRVAQKPMMKTGTKMKEEQRDRYGGEKIRKI